MMEDELEELENEKINLGTWKKLFKVIFKSKKALINVNRSYYHDLYRYFLSIIK